MKKIKTEKTEIEVMKEDLACCSENCKYKKGIMCRMYNEKLYGDENGYTRCGECFSEFGIMNGDINNVESID